MHETGTPRLRQRALFVACARNCASWLPRALNNFERMAEIYSAAAFLFFENDSTDSTKEILQAWCSSAADRRLMTFDGLAKCCPVRTLRLAMLRNRHLALLREECSDFEHLVVVVDCDDVNAGDFDADAFRRAVEFLESDDRHAGIFAAQDGLYYDLWALRHPELCPGDLWE